jgi:hypothetical protein
LKKFGLVLALIAVLIVAVWWRRRDPLMPDRRLTPGAVFADATVEQICAPGYANVLNGGERNVPASVKKEVFNEYFGAVPGHPGDYEIDHLIPLELGGDNSLRNLWPQSYSTKPWNSRVKDRLEDRMAALVRECLKTKGHRAATELLRQLQEEMASNWTNAYVKYVGPPPGVSSETDGRRDGK